MKETNIKGCQCCNTPFKEPVNVKVVKKIDIDIDLVMSMSTVVENYLSPTPLATCAKPSRTRERMCA
jgi:hypothetical protein